MTSSSSSESSSGSEVQSRATTPSSDIFGSCHTVLPKFYVQLPNEHSKPEVLKTLFDNHAIRGTLGVYLYTGSADLAIVDHTLEWKQEKVNVHGQTIQYEFSATIPDINSLKLVDAVHASHTLLLAAASLRSILSFSAGKERALHFVEKPAFSFLPLSLTPSFAPTFGGDLPEKKGNIPTLSEWRNLWSAWDLVTLRMIPRNMLHQKPINLRHKCLFYIGHIPTFLDMLLSKAIGGEPSEPNHFWNIFERGIDPHVDDPNYCHSHSEVPDKDEDWPALESILEFRNRVRARLTQLYDELETGKRRLSRKIARTLVMTIEHEGFHIETLLYMLIQRGGCGTLPPPGFMMPPWALLARNWENAPCPPSPTVVLGPEIVILGHDDSEANDKLGDMEFDVLGHTFGWDNESPARTVPVGRFRAEWRPVTNCEYEKFWRENTFVCMPRSWCMDGEELKVRTIYGLVSMEIARYWPVLAAYDDLALYAKSKGGRIPTEPELRLFLDKFDVGYEGGSNSGFRHWHPTPATTGLGAYGGRGSNGGVWEWTSTAFDSHEGISPTNLFTGYSTDFFDAKHQVVLGASYATIPRLASRRTLRNFYQHNYPYAWVSARVVYDM